MSQKNDDNDGKIEMMMEQLNRVGATIATVKEGHLLIFDRGFLQNLLDKTSGDRLTIMVKNPEFNN